MAYATSLSFIHAHGKDQIMNTEDDTTKLWKYTFGNRTENYNEFKEFVGTEYSLTVQTAISAFMQYALDPSTPVADLLHIFSFSPKYTQGNARVAQRKDTIGNITRILEEYPEGMLVIDMEQMFRERGIDIRNSHIGGAILQNPDKIDVSYRGGVASNGKVYKKLRFLKLKK